MKKLEQTTILERIVHDHQLPSLVSDLIREAKSQLDMAYAPYSNFYVGAAVLLANEKIYGGSNQENASYPLCMCAERTALYHAHANNKNIAVEAIAITAKNPKMKLIQPAMPCGACRQVICEYEMRHNHKISLYFITEENNIYKANSASSILPFGFDASFL